MGRKTRSPPMKSRSRTMDVQCRSRNFRFPSMAPSPWPALRMTPTMRRASFFLLFDPELTTAGRNLMDGRFSTFGYVVEGNDLLQNVEVGDRIISATVTDGLDNLKGGGK